jgi:hypothetical protein
MSVVRETAEIEVLVALLKSSELYQGSSKLHQEALIKALRDLKSSCKTHDCALVNLAIQAASNTGVRIWGLTELVCGLQVTDCES